MSHPAQETIYRAIASIPLIDPHTHINPHAPASRTLADLLGYHYYTELAHSSGMSKQQIEDPQVSSKELVRRLVANLQPLENTSQYHWLVAICKKFFGFDSDRIDESNWEQLYDSSERTMASAEWATMVLEQSNVQAVFLTNDFDDALSGFDTKTYLPCLRTDDLVFHFAKRATRERLEACTGISLTGSLSNLRDALRQRFEHFTSNGARACAISLPPTFEPAMISEGRATNALGAVLRHGESADKAHQAALSRAVFWMLAELCDEFALPFDLMIGVNRGVYAQGVFQGQDLYDSRVSLIQYRELFNAFPLVTFPVSVLASVTNQELVSYAWIFPNVVTNGHWWYSNTPSFIRRDAAARLEAVPQTKQIAYYSDAYKLEFVWPKFDMYRHVLAGILAEHFVGFNGWTEEQAIELGRKVLRGNVEEIFLKGQTNAVAETETTPPLDSLSLDLLPSDDEINALETPDVELTDASGEQFRPDAAGIDAEADSEPLDLGDFMSESSEVDSDDSELGWQEESSIEHSPQITPLRGEDSFEPDEDSLQLHPDPMTGELRFPTPSEIEPSEIEPSEIEPSEIEPGEIEPGENTTREIEAESPDDEERFKADDSKDH